MDKLINQIWEEWKAAKAAAQFQCERNAQYEMAQKLGSCKMFKGNEDLEELIKLIFSPKGIEFMSKYNFPGIETFRKFKPYYPERYGVYIDCGKIALSEVRKVFLVGNTIAELKYKETAGNRLYLMCNSRATIMASGYSVVRVEKDNTSEVSYITQDHAKVLI